MPRRRTRVRTSLGRVARGLAGAAAAGVLALAMALLINLGLLGAIGSPAGPGRLGLPTIAPTDAGTASMASVTTPCQDGGRAGPLAQEAPPRGCSSPPASWRPPGSSGPPPDDGGEPPGTASADD